MTNQSVTDQQLRDALDRFFNASELRALCFDLEIDYEALGGDSKRAKVLELVQYCERHGRTDDLINTIQRARPNIDWNDLSAAQQKPARKMGGSGSAQMGEPEPPDSTLSYDQPVGDSGSAQIGGRPPQQTAYADETNIVGNANITLQDLEIEASGHVGSDVPSNPFQTVTTHNGILLTERRGTRIYGLVTQKPWNLPVDVFVLPLGFGSSYSPGLLGKDLEADLVTVQAELPDKAFAQTLSTHTPSELLPGSPLLLMQNNSDFWTLPGTNRKAIAATATDGHGRTIPNSRIAATAIVKLAAANGLHCITIPPLGAGSGQLSERDVTLAMMDGILAALPATTPDGRVLDEIILTTINPDVLAALRQKFNKRPQAALNDQPAGRDLLHVETAVYALAEMCMLKDLNPPLAVGILGGWGSGKSFVMHLMQERIAQLRRRSVTEHTPYIGHVYQIKFDAWTYAKSNLWASLMQTIFYEMNAQLTRERELAKALAGDEDEATLNQVFRVGGPLWQVMAYPDVRQQQARDVINFAMELDAALRLVQPEEIAERAKAFIHGRRAERGRQVIEPEDLLWAELRKLKENELQELRQTEKNLADKQVNLEAARVALRQQVDKDIAKEAREAAWRPLQNAFKQQFGAATGAIEKMFTAVEPTDSPSIRQTIGNTTALVQMIRNNPTEFAAFLLFSLFLAVVMWVSQNVTFVLPGLVLTGGSIVIAFIRSYDKWLNLIRQSFVAYQLQVEVERNRLADGREDRIQQKLAEQTKEYNQAKQLGIRPHSNEIPALEEEIATLEAKARRQRQRVGITATYVSLLDFVSSRLDEAIYEKELGLMHQVQRDLQELTESLTSEGHNLFPRGPARVILYIDDLDRCPPPRVVEVLEAVQLLLKTDLFIVVLAIDVRFITRALETVYKGILTRQGSPSGLDYIEKIIQIPYQVQPIGEDAVKGYLEKQMTIAPEVAEPTADNVPVGGATDKKEPSSSGEKKQEGDDAGDGGKQEDAKNDGRVVPTDLPVEAVLISRTEYASMEKCCKQIAMTPRAVKRLSNVYKLLKIIWYREGSEPADHRMIDVVMALLALSEQYPNPMRDLFAALPREIKTGPGRNLLEVVLAQAPEEKQATFMGREWQQLGVDAKVLMPRMTLQDIDSHTFNLVRSFCFVGDIGYDPGELMKELVAQEVEKNAQPSAEKADETITDSSKKEK